jgi:hypothetical protein
MTTTIFSMKKTLSIVSSFITPFLLVLVFSACDNSIEVAKNMGDLSKLPDMSATNLEILYSDSAQVKGRVVTPEVNYFGAAQQPYYEYPKGIHVYFYDEKMKVIAEVSSKYAIYHDREKLWEARTNVVVVNVKGERLNTEQLFWDMNLQKIYSSKNCIISLPDGTQQIGKKGMDAREDFSNWNLYGAAGSVNVDDPE